MIFLVYGAGSSGKSAYAEELASSLGDNRYYLATMRKTSEEDEKRVKKHRLMREGKNFKTLEYPVKVRNAVKEICNCVQEEITEIDADESEILSGLKKTGGSEKLNKPERLKAAEKLSETVVLLECMSNLVANEMFVKEKDEYITIPEDVVVKTILEDIKELAKTENINNLVIVSNDVFEEGTDYDEATLSYIRALGRINAEIAAIADGVTEVVCGIPVKIKSEL